MVNIFLVNNLFDGCINLETLILPPNFPMEENIFKNIPSLTSLILLNYSGVSLDGTGLSSKAILYVQNNDSKKAYEGVNPEIAPERIRMVSEIPNIFSAKTVQISNYLMQRESYDEEGRCYYAIGAYRAGKREYTADKIKTITLVKNNIVPTDGSVIASWDASYNNDKSIMAWVTSAGIENNMKRYHLYIGGNGGIVAPEKSGYLFCGYEECTSINGLSILDTSNVSDMRGMFKDNYKLTNLNVSNFNTSKVTNMKNLFDNCKSLMNIDVSGLDTSNVTNMEKMFYCCESLTNLDASKINTSKVKNMNNMFGECRALTKLDVSRFNTSNVETMEYMFSNCSSLTSLNLSNFNTSNVKNMNYMFLECRKLTRLDVSNFDTSNVELISGMFKNCSGLTSLDVSSFDTSSVLLITEMFEGCSSLTTLDLSGFDLHNLRKL